MDITLERILSLIPKKDDGKFVHGAKKQFCESIGVPSNTVSEWVRGSMHSYKSYLYQIAAKYDVSVEWLKGETDDKQPKKKEEAEEPESLGKLTRNEIEAIWLLRALSPADRTRNYAELCIKLLDMGVDVPGRLAELEKMQK